ncbi:MAG: carboxypeptidase regulatory-like domain-containing protein, partial [Candidatus Electryonea clarkiae]|nr:carboxypeptidase regulatory-like domain-containing protein [Candidatus Electryonea clarkiae]
DQTYGGEELDIAVAIDETPDAGYVITGYTHSFGAGESDAYLVRLESEDRPPAPFSLVSPENDSTVLYAPPYDFENTWNPAIDHNPLDTVFYDVFFQVDWDEVGDTTLVFHHITGNSINFNIVDSLGLNIWALDLPPRRVDWWVVAISGDDTVECDETWYFGLESFDPGAPVAFNLINPFNNDTLGTNQTPLIWQSSSDPDSEDPLQYIIWWATDESFTENLDSMFTPDTLFMRQNLIDDTGYWWKVRAQDIGSIGRWSGQTNHLQVYIPEPPASFKLLTPNSGDTIVSDVGLMEWEEAIDPDPDDFVQYKVYWAEDEAFIAGLDSNTTNATSFWLTGLHHKQFYWWKVEALDFNTEGIWSDDVFHFMAYYPELNGALYLTDSNEAIAGARLVLTNVNEDSFTSLTDNDGRYIFYNVPTGEYSIEISHPDYVTMHESSILLMDGVTLDLDFSLERAYRSHTPLQPNYFELISFYIFPEDYFAETVFRSVGSLVVAVSDDDGVWRRPALNTIGEINAAEGYRLLSIADDTLHIEGNPIDVDIVYHLKEEKSNFLGYPFDFPASIESALSPIQDSIIFVQTDDGRIWSPSDTINTIETMIPGEGYMIQVSGDIEFTYNIESTQIVGNNSIRRELMSSDEEPRPTGLPYCVLVQLTDRIREKSPELIEIYDGFTLVGKERISLDHSITPVITWQGAPEFGVDGFAKGKPARIVIKNNAGTAISSRIIEDSIQFGKNAFARATVDYQVPLPDKFEVSAVYPNPFNASANLNFALPLEGEVEVGVFNIEGREIYHFVQHYSAGYHRFTFDSEASGLRLGSGMYFIRINQFENSVIRKVVLVK